MSSGSENTDMSFELRLSFERHQMEKTICLWIVKVSCPQSSSRTPSLSSICYYAKLAQILPFSTFPLKAL